MGLYLGQLLLTVRGPQHTYKSQKFPTGHSRFQVQGIRVTAHRFTIPGNKLCTSFEWLKYPNRPVDTTALVMYLGI